MVFFVVGLRLIDDDEVGLLTKKMRQERCRRADRGARWRDRRSGRYPDPGLYWRIPIIWNISKMPVTENLPSEVALWSRSTASPFLMGGCLPTR